MASSQDNSSVSPSTGSDPDHSIAPQLERALQNLNVNLEDELTRYRRKRHGRVNPPPPPRRKKQRQTIDLISVKAAPSDSAVNVPPANQPPKPPPPPPNPFLQAGTEPPTAAPPDIELPDVDELLEAQLSEIDESVAEGATGEAATGEAATGEVGIDETALPVQTTDNTPDGYLESSEELLKSLDDEKAEPDSIPEPYSPNRKNNGLLKLAGLVLVLLAGVGVGFAITYPSQLQKLRAQLFPGGTAPDTTEPAATTDGPSDATSDTPSAETTPAETAPDGYKPPGPDLSQREFVELDLESLSTLEVDGNRPNVPVPAPAQAPQTDTANPTAAAGTTPAAPPASSDPAAPSEPAATGETTPASDPAAETTPAAAGPNFYVITSYTGDASLNKAREFVPDAFVRNFNAGARIQLAAFDNQAQAADQVAALNQQGIAVELFGPTNE
ncbi:hypothetical protein [Leptothoe kymatousa]|uniref:SPOR domain-containing protein n=1 Tax=Leptothoe kymatousa TAU-MAC 1615 TaxID=2364775 RepID=A0ABS5XYV4_9CYAN|nr:hypothetical protein [Leptothoe kymatousa]MBT9310807.1 hypothetical protein [Leptothoe kymatousa TAU-MAC 1615]